jgi:hypothetical protein
VKLAGVSRWWQTKSANWLSTPSATKDIAALISAIQAETNEAVVVMEEGTKEVESGATLADQGTRAGCNFSVVRQSAELVQEISLASKTAGARHGRCGARRRLFPTLPATSQGTRGTVATVSQLVKLSDQLNEALSNSARRPNRPTPTRKPKKSIGSRCRWAHFARQHRTSVQQGCERIENDERTPGRATVSLTEHELSELRMLIEERTSIRFDESRERFFSTRVREHMVRKGHARGTDLLRSVKKTNFDFQELLESLLTQETSFFRYPGVFEAFEKRVLPELHIRKFWKNPRSLRIWSAGCSSGEEPYSVAITVADAISFSDAWNVRFWLQTLADGL